MTGVCSCKKSEQILPRSLRMEGSQLKAEAFYVETSLN